MVDIVPILAYAIGGVLLFGASVYAAKNYRITRDISRYWLIYALAMFAGGLQTPIYIFQLIYGVDPFLNGVRTGLAVIFAIMLALVAVELVTTDITEVLE